MRIIFEPQVSGHRREYLDHLIDYVEEEGLWGGVGFVVNESFRRPKTEDRRPKLDSRRKTEEVSIEFVASKESLRLLKGPVVWRSWKYYRLAKRYLRVFENRKSKIENRIPHLTFLWLNDIQLFLGLLGFPVSVSGILYKPFIRMQINSRRDQLIWKRKYWQTKLLVGQKKVEKIWILEDAAGVEELNTLYQTEKFALLPEPVSEWKAEEGYDVREDLKINPKSKLFIHVGTLSTRKGSDQIIRAINILAKEAEGKMTILMAGKPQPGHEEIMREAIESVKENEHIELIYKPQYLTEERFQATMEQADGILIPYRNPESSSGVLARAILNNKPVLGVDQGLMGAIIKKYGAGVVIESVTAGAIGEGIVELCEFEKKIDEEARDEFRVGHEPRRFAALVCEPIPQTPFPTSRRRGL